MRPFAGDVRRGVAREAEEDDRAATDAIGELAEEGCGDELRRGEAAEEEAHGLRVVQDPPALAQKLGLRVTESAGVVTIKNVLSDSLAERAGLAAGDEWIGVDDWRMTKLDDLPLYAGRAQQVTALVARDRQLVRLRLNLPKQAQAASWRLTVTDATKVAAWLDDKPLL